MADANRLTEIFADGVLTVTPANGVFRLVLGRQDENNRSRPVGRLLVPANQMPAMLRGVAKA